MKDLIRRLIPTRLRRGYRHLLGMTSTRLPLWARRLLSNLNVRVDFREDRARYLRHSLLEDDLIGPLHGRNLEAQITKDYHRIEKGLALPSPRRPFGSAVGARLEWLAAIARTDGLSSADVVPLAESASAALKKWNDEGVVEESIAPVRSSNSIGPILEDPETYFETRHSVRNFSSRSVSDAILHRAVMLALRTPSVCNRAPWSVRFYSEEDATKLLGFQNGNAGFGHTIPVVGLVTVDLRLFAGRGERNQAWVDGGLFAMSLVWALHSLGVDTCMLNTSFGNDTARRIRRDFEIDDAEVLITMVAIGYAEADARVARSPRRSIADVVAVWPNRRHAVGASTIRALAPSDGSDRSSTSVGSGD